MVKLKRLYVVILALFLVVAFNVPALPAWAASLSDMSDTLTTAAQNTVANHTILFTTPTGVPAGQTITLTFDTDFQDLAGITENDVDIADDTVDLTTAADCTGAEQASVAMASPTLTITICAGDGGDIAAASNVTIEIGTNATASGIGANQIKNPAAAETSMIALAGTMADSGTLSVVTIADDSVAVTATVNPSITFSITDTAIGFGALTSANARFATADGNGSDTDSTAAFTMDVSTNSTNGYAITYNGSTLTSGADTITVANITNDANGTANTEEFGMGLSASGDATVAAAYDHNATAGNRDWAFIDATTTTIVSENGPTATETISAFFLANISGNTEAGSYSTAITYIATATF
ncbi:MAG: hypothetical protein WCV50_04520 [Patescibacteria group bacterium]|jgi:hypothetical protein